MQLPESPQHISNLRAYEPGRSVEEIREALGLEKIIKLASNENPLGPSPKAVERINQSVDGLATYPNAGLELRDELAVHHGIGLENVAAGSGSESILMAAMRAYLQPGDEIITAEGTFIGFYVLCNSMNLNCRTVPLQNYTYDLEGISESITDQTKLIYLANPNNPTGTAFHRSVFEQFLERLPDGVLVILDEAYFEYAQEWDGYPNSMNYRHDQILTLRTFSKAYGLAGVRIGYGIGHPEIIENILKVKLPFEPTSLAQAAGLGALEDVEFLQKTVDTNRNGMRITVKALEGFGLRPPRSVANFVYVPMGSPDKAVWFSDELLKRGVIARPMTPFRLPEGVRITIGNEEETTFLIEVLNDIFAKGV